MKFGVDVALTPTPEQHQRLVELQRTFAAVCNALAPLVQSTRIWNRVALHHLAYRRLRQEFPEIGSQMVCNAIYSVSRACRMVFQAPESPFHHSRLEGKPLPRLHFTDSSPVYFDRHTLSLKGGQASMYTLDGRMKFQLTLKPEVEEAFHQRKLLEVALTRRADLFVLSFTFGTESQAGEGSAPVPSPVNLAAPEPLADAETAPTQAALGQTLPEYLLLEESA